MELKTLLQKNEHKPIIGSDYDGVISEGIIPERGTIILTGRKSETEDEMRELLPNKNKIYFFPDPEDLNDKNHDTLIAKWKSEMIQKLGIEKFYEDRKSQAKIIQEENPAVEIIHVKNEEEKETGELKFLVVSEFGEILDIAIHLSKVENYEVKLCILDNRFEKIGDGIVEKEQDWHRCIGQGYIWLIDGTGKYDLSEWLIEQGEYVVGPNKIMSDLENDRQLGQKLFKKAGFNQPFSRNFTDIDECIEFVKDNENKLWILKQNKDLPKHINYKGKFDDNSDMLYHLTELKKSWNENEYGSGFDCDLMEVVSGMEIAVSAFYNGHDFMRNKEGKRIGYFNWEYKKISDGDLGANCGEMGTLFLGVDEDNKMFSDIILKPELEEKLKESNYHGVIDINCIVTKKGITALEFTSRFGIPGASYEFINGLKTNTGEFLASIAKGEDNPVEVIRDWGMVMVVVAKPFPIESELSDEDTSLGEKLWILGQNGLPRADFSPDQLKNIHLENFKKNDDNEYVVSTKGGYLLTVCGTGKTIEKTRENLKKYIKENIYLCDMSYRTDIGKRTEEDLEEFSIE